MTQKICGPITVYVEGDNVQIHFPRCTIIPSKQEWSKHLIWQFNGKAYKPLTPLAEANLANAVNAIQAEGFTKATKEGKRKPTSIRYAILTTGIEPFYFIK